MNKRANSAYVFGNNAYKLDTYKEDSREYKKREVDRKTRPIKRTSGNYGLISSSSFLLIATLVVCIILLNVQFGVSASGEDLLRLERELQALRLENQKIEENIDKHIGLDEIYYIATNELKMIMPGSKQIKYYTINNESYTQQLANITVPTKEEQATLSSVIGFISKGWD